MLDDELGPRELLDVAIKRVSWSIKRCGDLRDRTRGDHSHRFDDLKSDRRYEDAPSLWRRDEVHRWSRHAKIVTDCCLYGQKDNDEAMNSNHTGAGMLPPVDRTTRIVGPIYLKDYLSRLATNRAKLILEMSVAIPFA